MVFDKQHDFEHKQGELIDAALVSIPQNPDSRLSKGILKAKKWDKFLDKIELKPDIERLAVGGAFLAAEFDRQAND